MAFSRIAATVGVLSVLIGATTVQAAEIVVVSTIAVKESLIDIVPMFERASGHKVNITFGSGPIVFEQVRAGATGDLFLGPDEFSEPLLKEGKLVAGSRVDFAHSGASVAVHAGAHKPDVSTPERFKAALLSAKTVSYSRGASGLFFVRVLERLGIAEEIRAKLVAPKPGELVGAVVARGEAEIGIHQLSELLPISGIDIIGPLPAELQRKIVYSAFAFPASTQQEPARMFVTFLRTGVAGAIIRRKGMEPA
jgi:molybdate transport system substrate-binding protein